MPPTVSRRAAQPASLATAVALLLGVGLVLPGAAASSAQAGQARPPAAPPPKPVEKPGDKPADTPAGQPAQKPAATPPARTATDRQFERLSREATAAREAGRVEDSVALYEQAVRLRPSWTEGHWYLGTGYYELDRYAEARDAFRRVTRDQPENGAAFGFKGLCEYRLGSYETALEDLRRGWDLGVGGHEDLLWSVRYHLGIVLTRLQQYEHALNTLTPFAHEGNDTPSVVGAFGLAALRMPMLPEELPPDRRELVMLAGRASFYQAARRARAADLAFEELLTRFPDNPNVHYAAGVYFLGENPDRALDLFRRELELSPSHVLAMLQIAYEYIKRSDWDAAQPWAERALEIEPNDFTARRAVGQVLLELGDLPGAIGHLEAGVKLAPDSPSMRFTLARAYQRARRMEDAERERAEFRRLERMVRTARHGEQSVGGIDDRTGVREP